jgi:hypothetical protein
LTHSLWVQNFVQHLMLGAYEHRHSLHEVGAVQTTNIPLLQSKHLNRVFTFQNICLVDGYSF